MVPSVPGIPFLCFARRYSHTAHVHDGKLLLVGGVWLLAPSVPGVAVVDLITGASVEYRIDVVSAEKGLCRGLCSG